MQPNVRRSKLDDIYSLSNKITCKQYMEGIPNAQKLYTDLANSVYKYIDNVTGKVKSDIITVREKCPLCDSKSCRFIFVKDGFDHVVCNSCDLIYTLQVLDSEKIKFLEDGVEGDAYGEYKQKSIIGELDRKKFEIVFEQMEQYKKIKTIFDFGSQAGTFLDWTQERGYDVIGHEYHIHLRNIAQRKGHVVLNDDLQTIKLEKEFDVITCWDYIDHVLNPREVIQNLGKYLKKGGLFFYAINNRDSLSTKLLHQYSANFIGPHHTMNYGINQLKLLMKDYEFLYAESYVSELNMISNWMNFDNLYFGDTPLSFELFDPKKISELGMGIKLNAIFKKR